MKVILLQELRGKGGEGDVVDVATGYAVNYLFPKKIAIEASKGNLKQLELRRHNIAKRESSRLDTADKMLAALEGKLVMIAAKVGEEGQLFGSVTTSQIAEALSVLHKIDVDRKSIDLKGPIKAIGEHAAVVSIYRDVKANIMVFVYDEKHPPEETMELVAESVAVDSDAAVDSETNVDKTEDPGAENSEVEVTEAVAVEPETAES